MNTIFKISLCMTIFAFIVGLSGCEPKEQVNERQERLYSVENMELKKQVAELKDKYEQDLAEKQQQLVECMADNSRLEKQAQEESLKALQQSSVNMLMEQNSRLQNENNRLRAEVEELKKETEQKD